MGPDGLARAAALFSALSHTPLALLSESSLKAVMRGESADAGVSALLELLLSLTAALATDGSETDGSSSTALPAQQADSVARSLLDALSRMSSHTLAAALAAFPHLGLSNSGARLLSKLSTEYAKRPVQQPDPALVLAVLRGLAGAADASDAASGGASGSVLRSITTALLTRLWDDLRPALTGLSSSDLVAATGLLARLGCLSPATRWKAEAAEAVAAELRSRLAPDGLQPSMVAAVPGLLHTLQQAEQHPGSRELAAEVQRAVDEALQHAPAGALWRSVVELVRQQDGARASFEDGGLGAQLLDAVAPRLADIVAAAAERRASRSSDGDSDGDGTPAGAQAQEDAEADACAPDLDTLPAVVEVWAKQQGRTRSYGAALLAWLDLPCVIEAALGQLVTAVGGDGAGDGTTTQKLQPAPLDSRSWHALARLLRAVVQVVEISAAVVQERRRRREQQGKDKTAGQQQQEGHYHVPADEHEEGDDLDVEVAPPMGFVGDCLSVVQAQGRPPGNGGAAKCAASDAVSLLWSLSVLGALDLGLWDVLAIALDKPGLEFDEQQLAAVFEAHALVLLRLHGVQPLPTPAGELQRCRSAYWAHFLAPQAASRAALAGSLARAGLLQTAAATVQGQGHLLLLDCLDAGECLEVGDKACLCS